MSSIIACRDDFINVRSEFINDKMRIVCKHYGWLLMDNSNINCSHLRDTVHLNEEGQRIFLNNLLSILKFVW